MRSLRITAQYIYKLSFVAMMSFAVNACRSNSEASTEARRNASLPQPTQLGAGAAKSKPLWKKADARSVLAQVREERKSLKARGTLVVYVGASWCEPCARFHDAIAKGTLDERYSGVTFLEFDLDERREELVAAGYHSGYVPYFATVDEAGAVQRTFSGSVKGEEGVARILPKLDALLTP
jgi:thiol-disulfide isomerase/thioredoxin